MRGKVEFKKIVQIMQADQWSAVWAIRDDTGNWVALVDPLVAWALVHVWEDESLYQSGEPCQWSEVVGMDTGAEGLVDRVDDGDNFIGYLPHGLDVMAAFGAQIADYGSRQDSKSVRA